MTTQYSFRSVCRAFCLAWLLTFSWTDVVHAALAPAPAAPADQPLTDVDKKSIGCIGCHTETDRLSMHDNPAVKLGCTDCHGGDASQIPERGLARLEFEYKRLRDLAHVLPKYPEEWNYPHSAKPQRSYTLLNRESPEYIRFVNPGDYRVADKACGACHGTIIAQAERSLMSTSAMLLGGASYNNGILPYKRYILGESYTSTGEAAAIKGPVLPDPASALALHGVLPELLPIPHWETAPTPDIFRVFEQGGRVTGNRFPEIGLPNLTGGIQALNEPGRPDLHVSNRGNGTGGRISIPVLNVHKTRLNDPHMWFMGTNDQPGDYRSSGCAGCHVVYANDRDPLHSGPYASTGNTAMSRSVDPVIPKHESGHPLAHRFTRAIPTSQCMTCHMHQPNVFMNTFMGYTMWDYEADAPAMWPEKQKYPSEEEIRQVNDRNPEGAAPKGKWADVDFLTHVSELNPKLHDTQFADYHGHGWNFRAVYKRDRMGTCWMPRAPSCRTTIRRSFRRPSIWPPSTWTRACSVWIVTLPRTITATATSTARLRRPSKSPASTVTARSMPIPTLRTSGPAAPPQGTDLGLLRNPDGGKRFEWRDGKLYQRSLVTPGLEWRVHLVKDSVTPTSPDYNEKSARAKLMSNDTTGQAWGLSVPPEQRAHGSSKMECYSCHTSWTTSCAGCHLPAEANWKTASHHYEGKESRVYATYNPQVARDDMFMLGKRGPTDGGRIAPVRSSSALVVSSTNINREHIYIQQPPISASGYSSQAFNPHYPHTERTTETKTCDDCHLSGANDNNAIMAQLLLQGTNFVNFIGHEAWLGTAGGLSGVQVTEWDEPQAVIGSYLQKYAYPDNYKRHQQLHQVLQTAHDHLGDPIRCLQMRGEYVYAAEGHHGMQVYDVASIANKAVSQPILTGPSSPLGHDTRIASKDATCVALPTNQPIHPDRNKGGLMRDDNEEQPFHPIYNYALLTDSKEGLILTDVNTLADANPRNNQLRRALTWNQNGILKGARHLTIGGHFVYVAADAGLVILNLDNPLRPQVESVVPLHDVRASALQFRYLWVTDSEGLKVIEITDKQHPRLVDGVIPLQDAHRVYLARTYAYVAAGRQGLAIVDIEKPEHMELHQLLTVPGAVSDVRDVIVGSTNASLFAYVADGRNGLTVLQLTAPDTQPKFYGFSPEPKPRVIARYPTKAPALALSKGLDRDRGVDETGHQIAVFGRIGSRPLTLKEAERLYLDTDGKPWLAKPQ